jgi:hypothetical protein
MVALRLLLCFGFFSQNAQIAHMLHILTKATGKGATVSGNRQQEVVL